ncbi:MAG: cellulose synthase subunit BcsC-related outer membrane protein [Pseudomonas sp.]
MRHPRRALAIATLMVLAATASAALPGDPQALLIEQGNYWQSQNNPDRAKAAWQKLLLLTPDQPDALYGLGLVSVQQKDLPAARKYLAQLQALIPPPRSALQLDQEINLASEDKSALLSKARELVDADKYDEAIAAYRQAFGDRQPQGTLAREYYYILGYTNGGEHEARSGLERLLQEQPNDPVIALFLAKHLVRVVPSRAEGIRALAKLANNKEVGGDANESWRFALQWIGPPSPEQVPLFQQFLAAHPKDEEIRAQMNKGIALSRPRNPTTMPNKAAPVWQRDPLDASGLKALEANDLTTAEQQLQTRLKDKPNDPDALGGMGIVRQKQNRLDEAEGYLLRASQQANGHAWKTALDDVRYWKLLAQAEDNRQAGRLQQAQQLAEQATRQKPGEPTAAVALAQLQAQTGQPGAAESGFRRVLASHPQNTSALSGLVAVLAQEGKNDEAQKLIDSVPAAQQSSLAPGIHVRSLRATEAGKLAEKKGDLNTAAQYYKDALTDDPDNTWTRFALARIYLGQGHTQAARDQISDVLKHHPDQPDALYTSTLLSVQLGEWQRAQASLARITPAKRNRDMNELARDIELHVQTEAAVDSVKRGQQQEALALLARCEPLAGNKPERVAIVASAYIDAGDPERGIALMRGLLDRAPMPGAGLKLLYASILLKANKDAEASDILRSVQDERLSEAERERYVDMVYLYRVKQADQLREKGDLVAAYDMLAPALAQHPHDTLAVSALARMYTASGDHRKALALYKPLLQNDPRNADLQLGVADLAAQEHDYALADRALKQALTLKPGVPQVLTESARIYRSMGQTGQATDLLRRAVNIEDGQENDRGRLASGSAMAPANPFLNLPGQHRRKAITTADAMIPTAVETDSLSASDADASSPFDLPDTPPAKPYARKTSAASANPFAADSLTDSDQPADMSPAQRALNEILQERSGYIAQGLSIRSNNNESGLSKLTDVETPFEVNVPMGDNRVALRVTPVFLNAGGVKDAALTRFGSGQATGDPGSQKANGVGLAVAVENPEHGIKADVGVSPLGFTYNTIVGGVSVDQPFRDNAALRYIVAVSRRPVTDSVTSFAGTRDDRTGEEWGGVTANGGRGQLSYDNQSYGVYGYGSWHKLVGNNVASNSRAEVGSGIYWYVDNEPDSKLSVGLSASALSYDKNESFFTAGQGGYFSPQSFFSLAVPVTLSQRSERFTYQIKGAVGVQHVEQDGATFFPGHSADQALNNQTYPSSSSTGIGYNLSAVGEYKLNSNFFLGGTLGVDNARDYREVRASMYLRYFFENMTGPMSLPVSPYRSPYSN